MMYTAPRPRMLTAALTLAGISCHAAGQTGVYQIVVPTGTTHQFTDDILDTGSMDVGPGATVVIDADTCNMLVLDRIDIDRFYAHPGGNGSTGSASGGRGGDGFLDNGDISAFAAACLAGC